MNSVTFNCRSLSNISVWAFKSTKTTPALSRCARPRACSTAHNGREHHSRCTNNAVAPFAGQGRRFTVLTLVASLCATTSWPALAQDALIRKVRVRPELAPDQSQYDGSDSRLRAAAQLLQDALNAPTVEKEEALWSKIIDEYSNVDANWVPDLVGRAWGNRGNARSRQGKLEAALRDYTTAIEICPWSVDPLLNRGAVLEQLGSLERQKRNGFLRVALNHPAAWDNLGTLHIGICDKTMNAAMKWSPQCRFREAEEDYLSVLDVAPNDPAAWNNLGNTNMGMGNWDKAVECFGKAASLSSRFSFASANRCVALFAAGSVNESIREMRTLLRRYPDFADTRAALTAALWSVGKEADAESNWQRVNDPRYRDPVWLKEDRRWPPPLVQALTAFLQIRSVT